MVGALELIPNRHSRRPHRNRYICHFAVRDNEDSGANWASSSKIFFLRTRTPNSQVPHGSPFTQLQVSTNAVILPLSRNLMPTPVRSSSSEKQNHSLRLWASTQLGAKKGEKKEEKTRWPQTPEISGDIIQVLLQCTGVYVLVVIGCHK